MAITIGQFLGLRKSNPDSPADPYNPSKESLLELVIPEVPFSPSSPAALPPPPAVGLSSPAAVPGPPNVILSSPAGLPPEPAPPHGSPAVLPPPPNVTLSSRAALPPPPPAFLSSPAPLPPEPAPPHGSPAPLPLPPNVVLSSPGALPPIPAVPQSVPGVLPGAPPVVLSQPKPLPAEPAPARGVAAVLPAPPAVGQSIPLILPNPPDVAINPAHDPAAVNPVATPGTSYKILGDKYSPVIGPADPGSLASDPFLYERSIERSLGLGPAKIALHSLVQTANFAQNVFGNIWNPEMINPAPIRQNFVRPAIDLPPEGTEKMQVQIGDLVNTAMKGALTPNAPNDPTSRLLNGVAKSGVQVQLARIKRPGGLADSFNKLKTGILALGSAIGAGGQAEDPLRATVFDNGVIPMRLKGDNGVGFRTFRKEQGDSTNDDDVYVPLSFTDLRPIGDSYRAVYFRPLDLQLAESFTPEWNKASYYGRVDPVVTYQSTGRSFSVSFKLVAFGPEDVRTIYQKLHWLASMVYPEYDNNLVYKSGPVVRMRVGDVMNGFGAEKGKGLAGIIESLDFDYNDTLWELKKDFKLPRNVGVSLTFTVLHDLPIGRGAQGQFGGLGEITQEGLFKVVTAGPAGASGDSGVKVSPNGFRNFSGGAKDLLYDTFAAVDKEKP